MSPLGTDTGKVIISHKVDGDAIDVDFWDDSADHFDTYFYTLGELSLRNRASWVAYEMDKLHDRVMKVKNIVPPEPPRLRPWWKLWGN